MKIPVSLITGFLGCGKTTLLKKVIHDNRDRRIVYLINDFSRMDVDAALLQQEGDNVVSIPGGSIFCKCLVTEFIGNLKKVIEEFHTAETPVEGVIIEASGMADPLVVSDMLRETGLDEHYEIRSIVSIVDPRSFRKLVKTLPNIISQIEAADTVLLNKTDLYDEPQIAETETAVREIKPDVTLIRCSFSNVELDLLGGQSKAAALHGEYAKCKDPHYDRFETPNNAPADPDRIKQFIQENEDDIFRVKGYLQTEEGTVFFDYSKAGFRIEKTPRSNPQYGLAWIVRGGTEEKIRTLALNCS